MTLSDLWNKSAENCPLSHQWQVSSRASRSMDLLLNCDTTMFWQFLFPFYYCSLWEKSFISKTSPIEWSGRNFVKQASSTWGVLLPLHIAKQSGVCVWGKGGHLAHSEMAFQNAISHTVVPWNFLPKPNFSHSSWHIAMKLNIFPCGRHKSTFGDLILSVKNFIGTNVTKQLPRKRVTVERNRRNFRAPHGSK